MSVTNILEKLGIAEPQILSAAETARATSRAKPARATSTPFKRGGMIPYSSSGARESARRVAQEVRAARLARIMGVLRKAKPLAFPVGLGTLGAAGLGAWASRRPMSSRKNKKVQPTAGSMLRGAGGGLAGGALGALKGGLGSGMLGLALNPLVPKSMRRKFIAQHLAVGSALGGLFGSLSGGVESGKKSWQRAQPKEKKAEGLTSAVMVADDLIPLAIRTLGKSGKKTPTKQQVHQELEDLKGKVAMKTPDILPGGKADKKPDSNFSAQQIAKGEKVEREHTTNPALAHEIAKDHLAEIPDYYTRLDKMEEAAKKKQAGDMPHFLDQDRPAKVKEIYSAIKRDHPDMPAEMKARIAARQGKPGKQHQGPPYKAPLTGEKQASLNLALGQLWSEGPGQFSKHAAGQYFAYRCRKDQADREALGPGFCKVAAASQKDPWDLAREVVAHFPTFEKAAGSQDRGVRELSQFYLAWACEMEKKANLLTGAANLLTKGKDVAKAGIGALRSSKGQMAKAIGQVESGGALQAGLSPGKAMAREAKRMETLKQMGGGSISRGQQLHAGNVAGRAPGSPPVAPPVAPPMAAPPAADTGGMWNKAKGWVAPTAVGAGLGVAGTSMMGGQEAPVPVGY